jgi:solute:Na+ symporter, SSS family
VERHRAAAVRLLPTIIGMCAFAAFPELGNQELALPKAMKEMMPFGISALALAAIFAAEVSTCDTVLYMLATSLSKDLLPDLLPARSGRCGPLKVSQKLTVVCGVVGVFIAYYMANIITALAISTA